MSYHARQLYSPVKFVLALWLWRCHHDKSWRNCFIVAWAITYAFVMRDEADTWTHRDRREWQHD